MITKHFFVPEMHWLRTKRDWKRLQTRWWGHQSTAPSQSPTFIISISHHQHQHQQLFIWKAKGSIWQTAFSNFSSAPFINNSIISNVWYPAPNTYPIFASKRLIPWQFLLGIQTVLTKAHFTGGDQTTGVSNCWRWRQMQSTLTLFGYRVNRLFPETKEAEKT